jgi:1-deoxy-D-xylulose-5-phosphate synthase
MGIPDRFVEHGTQAELYKEVGLDMEALRRNISELLK